MKDRERSKWYFEEQEYEEKDGCRSWKSWQLHSNKHGGYSDNEITFNIYDDGNISIWDADEGVFINKNQIKFLVEFLKINGLLVG